jgi:superfamily I DNA/RNA helicase
VDFDDLLLWVAMLLEDKPAVRDKYARRFEHVLVDEFQDTNMAQYVLLKHLASFHGNIFVVGDTDQSIYRWRGADYRNVLRFEKDYPYSGDPAGAKLPFYPNHPGCGHGGHRPKPATNSGKNCLPNAVLGQR